MSKALDAGGTTLRDHVDAHGEPGWFQLQLTVYGRRGEPCVSCGMELHETREGGRSTFFCPRCQDDPRSGPGHAADWRPHEPELRTQARAKSSQAKCSGQELRNKEELRMKQDRDAKNLGLKRVWIGHPKPPARLLEDFAACGMEIAKLDPASILSDVGELDLVLLPPDRPDCNPLLLCAALKAPRRARSTSASSAPRRSCPESSRSHSSASRMAASRRVKSTDEHLLASMLRILDRPQPKVSPEELLKQLEGKIGGNPAELADRVMTGLSAERERSFVERVTDPESGLFEGEFMAFKLEEEFKRSWRFRSPLSVLLVDLPGTRQLADERSAVLSRIAGVFLNECRDIDVVGRFDETTFLLLLPHTGSQGAKVLAGRVLEAIENHVESPIPIEAAVAIVSMPRHGIERKDDLLDLARLTLIQAWSAKGDERIQLAN
jgi:GGDEF domain-containing protein